MEEVCEIMKENPLETYTIKSGETLLDNELAAVNGSGTVQRAADTSGLTTLGIVKSAREGKAEIVGGIFLLANSSTNAVTRAYVGKAAYVEDKKTVATTSTNGVVAGLVIDVTSDGVWVDLRTPSLAIARALHSIAANATAIATNAAAIAVLQG